MGIMRVSICGVVVLEITLNKGERKQRWAWDCYKEVNMRGFTLTIMVEGSTLVSQQDESPCSAGVWMS